MNILDRLRSDFSLLTGLRATLRSYERVETDSAYTIGKQTEETVDAHADRIAIRFEGRDLTYRALDQRANRYADWALAQGLTKGDAVALLMTNQPDFICAWLGLAKVGVIAGLINTNLSGQTLAHAITIAKAEHVIVSSDLAPALAGALPLLATPATAWSLRGAPGMHDLDAALEAASAERPAKTIQDTVTREDTALYVYTSGTTGAPKAARMVHRRVLGMMRAFIGAGKATPEDRTYLTLPLYHGTGGLCGVGFALTTGGTLILRRKFSATHFWQEAASERATVFFYIGELCRYLVNQPPSPADTRHSFRLGVGNGLRGDVWEKFQPRFRIPKLYEFYGSTEGNVTLLNFDGKPGAVGRIPKWLEKRVNVRIVKFDVEREEPVRGPDGLCIEAAADENGEAVGKIDTAEARYRFEGYAGDAKQTERKLMRDVFEKGDLWFRTGDLMRRDKDGYFYFVDRIGDTFRWKGENVSTNEVADILAQAPGVKEVNVYGVKVGDLDGRAGMAALILEPGADVEALYPYVVGALPAYARPMFLRIQPEIEITGTFKYRKVDLVSDGFDPSKTPDQIWFDHPEQKRYVPMTPALHAQVTAGAFRM